MEPGQTWAYRARKTEPLVAVEVVKIGANRPPKVFIQFVDDSFEGRQEWVPAGRPFPTENQHYSPEGGLP